MNHRQALLVKGAVRKVAWIPQKHAVVGGMVRLHDEDGWRVDAVYSVMESSFVQDRERDYRYQRRVSDV